MFDNDMPVTTQSRDSIARPQDPIASRRSATSARRREPPLPPRPSWFGASPSGAPPRRDRTDERTARREEEDFGPMGAVPHDVCEEYNSN